MSIGEAIDRAAREHADLVAAAARQQPGAWGALAAKGVVAYRELVGRRPTDAERRAIWAGLWAHVAARGPRTCGHAIDERRYAGCAVCVGLRLCLDCARTHRCARECADAGCAAGGCVRMVRDGVSSESFGIS